MVKKNPGVRTTVQILFTAMTNGYAAGFAKGKIYTGPTKSLCVPGLNCYSCPGALGSCPIGSLQAVLASREYKFSFYLFGFFMIIGAILGRFVCGWLCPFGLFQDLVFKIPGLKKITKVPGDRFLRYFKYIVLVVFVILLPLFVADITGLGDPWFCKYICPSGTLMAGIPLVVMNEGLRSAIGWLFTWKLAILAITIVLSVLLYRPFCRYVCPLGALYGFFNRISLYRITLDPSTCIHCGKCEKACPLDVPVLTVQNSTECIRCGKCTDVCPTQALTMGFKRKSQ